MATSLPRLNVTLSEQIAETIKGMAKNTKRSMSAVAAELIENAIDNDEDLHFSELAEHRESTSGKLLSNDEFWERVLRD